MDAEDDARTEPWSVSERELMAATVARWNSCPFCVGAHPAIAVRGMDRAVTDAVLEDYRSAPISARPGQR